jgi:3-hydroxybutyrate dehydrogenase
MTSLKGKVALVTGSTSGIGLGIARAMAGKGADLVLNGFGDKAEIEKLRKGVADEFKVKAIYAGADMTKPDEIYAMIKKALAELGRIDILVNNAGIQHVAPIQDFPIDRWDAIIAVNLSASFHTIRAALPQMLKRNWGRIINIASVQGLVGSTNKVAYNSAKHGLVGLTKVVALETATTGVTCNAICPGWVLTPLVQIQVDARAAEKKFSVKQAEQDLLAEKQPSQTFVTTEQVGVLAVYLCSDGAAQIRGVALPIDGGWTAQ